jgi:hypothetical protein
MDMIIIELHDQSRTAFRRSRVVFNAAQRLTGYDPTPSAQEQSELSGLDSPDKVAQAAKEVLATAVHLRSEIKSVAFLFHTEADFNLRLNRVCDAAGSALHAQSLIAQVNGDQVLAATFSAQAKVAFAEAAEYLRRSLEMSEQAK